jgi:YD repeat-containing protein
MGYQYDGFGRLKDAIGFEQNIQTGAISNTDATAERNLTYDANGNILSLTRRWQGVSVDVLSYKYDPQMPDRLLNVRDQGRVQTEPPAPAYTENCTRGYLFLAADPINLIDLDRRQATWVGRRS